MTAASLGFRSGSNGSLHQQLQNGAFSATQPISLRRASRSVSGRIYKFVGRRRKVGILLMLMISVTVLSFVSVISRGQLQVLLSLVVNLIQNCRLVITFISNIILPCI